MTPPNQLLISSTRVEEGHYDRVTVWNRGGNAGTLTVQKGDGAEVAARLMGGEGAKTVTISEERFAELVRCHGLSVDLGEELRCAMAQLQLVEKDRHDLAVEVAELRGRVTRMQDAVVNGGEDLVWPRGGRERSE
jgi:hypothetical protein